MGDSGQPPRGDASFSLSGWLGLLAALRFAFELALLTAYTVIGAGLVVGPVRWLLAAVLPAVVATLWGVFLSPKRSVALPLAARIVAELVLFAVAAWGLARLGHPLWATVLVVGEVLVLGALRGPDRDLSGAPSGG